MDNKRNDNWLTDRAGELEEFFKEKKGGENKPQGQDSQIDKAAQKAAPVSEPKEKVVSEIVGEKGTHAADAGKAAEKPAVATTPIKVKPEGEAKHEAPVKNEPPEKSHTEIPAKKAEKTVYDSGKKKTQAVKPAAKPDKKKKTEKKVKAAKSIKKNPAGKKKSTKAAIIAVVGAFVVFLVLAGIGVHNSNSPEIEKISEPKAKASNTVNAKIDISPTIKLDGKRLDNIGFKNCNKYKTMQLTLKLEENAPTDECYVSPVIKNGEVLVSDKAPKGMLEKLRKGNNQAFASIVVYDDEGNKVSESLFAVTIQKSTTHHLEPDGS